MSEPYPNPFNPVTMIEFSVPRKGEVALTVFNAFGEEVATLFDGSAEPGSTRAMPFDATQLASGVYFARMAAGGTIQVKKMLLLR